MGRFALEAKGIITPFMSAKKLAPLLALMYFGLPPELHFQAVLLKTKQLSCELIGKEKEKQILASLQSVATSHSHPILAALKTPPGYTADT